MSRNETHRRARAHGPAADVEQRRRFPPGAAVAEPLSYIGRTRFPEVTAMRIHRLTCLLALAAALAGCERSPSGGGPGVGEDELVFIRADDDAPPLEASQVRLWAVQGEDSEVRIRYGTDGQAGECLRFAIDDDTRLRRPDGTRVAEGDSVLITIDVVRYDRFHFRFSPAGLRFEGEPAELRMNYALANPDYNGDGRVDDDDEDFDFGFWRQEAPGLPWQRVGDLRVHDVTEVRGDLHGFTGYALAGGTRQAAD